MLKKFTALFIIAILAGSLAACNINGTGTAESSAVTSAAGVAKESTTQTSTEAATESQKQSKQTESIITTAYTTSNGMIDAGEMFTNRDLTQTADLTDAKYCTVSDGQNISITSEGVYVISGSASNVTITVDAGDEDKVQIVLDGVSITNTSSPCIYVKNADKVFVTTTSSDNTLSATSTFTADGTTNTDAVIFSKDDLVLNGQGTLNISSTDNGISVRTTSRLRAALSLSTVSQTESKRTTPSRSRTAISRSRHRRTLSTPRTTRTTAQAMSTSAAAHSTLTRAATESRRQPLLRSTAAHSTSPLPRESKAPLFR